MTAVTNTTDLVQIENTLESKYSKGCLKSIFNDSVMTDPNFSRAVNSTSNPEISQDALMFLADKESLNISSFLGFIAYRFATNDKLLFKCKCATNPNKASQDEKYLTESFFKVFVEKPTNTLFSELIQSGLVELNLTQGTVSSIVIFSDAEKIDISQNYRPSPMVVPPRKITRPHHTAYLSNDVPGGMFCKSVYTDLPADDEFFMLRNSVDVINMVNSIGYSVNKTISSKYEYTTREFMPTKELLKFREENKNMADFYSEVGHLYLTWAYDCRGRFYDSGYQLKVQGTTFLKNQLEFANKEVLHD